MWLSVASRLVLTFVEATRDARKRMIVRVSAKASIGACLDRQSDLNTNDHDDNIRLRVIIHGHV